MELKNCIFIYVDDKLYFDVKDKNKIKEKRNKIMRNLSELYKVKLSDITIEELFFVSEFTFNEKIKRLNYLELRNLFFKLYDNEKVHKIVLGSNSLIDKHQEFDYQSDHCLELKRNQIVGDDDIDYNNENYKNWSYKFYTILELFRLGNVNNISEGWNKLGNNIKTVKDVLEKMN
ncbi:hypothetical protein [Candidatus Phytoplasma asteris]|uniref:Uncharacterized protein n=1 Tax=Candidatus Phytoplasma asteris TaxID=85620 RepID=A0ABZ3CFQ6_9MOLU